MPSGLVFSHLEVFGTASKKTVKLPIEENDKELTLLEFLRAHDLPIGSSCGGEGKCLKCLSSEKILTCQIKMKDNTHQKISFSYL